MLTINPHFKAPKAAPDILTKIPKATALSSLSNALAKRCTAITINIKVIENAIIELYSDTKPKEFDKKFATILENFIDPQTPINSAANEAKANINPLLKPCHIPHSKGIAITISRTFMNMFKY